MNERHEEVWKLRDREVRVVVVQGASGVAMRLDAGRLLVSLPRGMSRRDREETLATLRAQAEEGLF